MDNDWKKRLGVVYSTGEDFDYEYQSGGGKETKPAEKQLLYVSLDRKNRKGKSVTLVANFQGSDDDLKELEKQLKSKCGVGGSAKNGEILLQGDHREKVIKILSDKGYKVKRSGG